MTAVQESCKPFSDFWAASYDSRGQVICGTQAEALEEQTTKVQRLQENVKQRQGKSRAELEAELAQESGALSGMQVWFYHESNACLTALHDHRLAHYAPMQLPDASVQTWQLPVMYFALRLPVL